MLENGTNKKHYGFVYITVCSFLSASMTIARIWRQTDLQCSAVLLWLIQCKKKKKIAAPNYFSDSFP